jgi:dolichol kinase
VLSIICFLAMAWGDSVTSLIRYKVYGRAVKGLWGSAGMFGTCLIIAWVFVHPFWVGAITALTATVAEWACGDVGVIKFVDDNIGIPIVSLATLFGILAAIGAL